MSNWYSDGRLTYGEADELVAQYLETVGLTRTHTTSVDVLKWADIECNHHNKIRVYDALSLACDVDEENWAGRTRFRIKNTEKP